MTHAAASALSVLGIIRNPRSITEQRGEPRARLFWQKMKDAYVDGISLPEFARRLDELDFELTLAHVAGAHYRILNFTRTALQKGQPVILSFAPVGCPRQLHAVLATGTAGTTIARRFVPSAILITDSSESHPGIGPHNARLEFSPSAKRERNGLYITAWASYRVTLAAAMSLRPVGSKRSDGKSP